MTNNPEVGEDEEEIINENMYSSDVVDPLSDPLAIDDVIINQTEENGSEFASSSTALTELDSSAEGQIILVDVNSLKNAFPAATASVPYENCSSSAAFEMNGSCNISTSNITSHLRNSKDSDIVEDNYDGLGTSLALNVSGVDGVGVTFESIALAFDEDNINDEIEGVRSDGSDSGLGLELSASLLLDKASTTLSGNMLVVVVFFLFDTQLPCNSTSKVPFRM